MKSKKLIVLALSAIGILGLTACEEVVAKATDYSDKLVTVEGYDQEIYNNKISVVYDSIRDGNISADVLKELLYSYSITTFGFYNKYSTPAPAEGTVTLEDARNDITYNEETGKFAAGEKAVGFIKAHKAYWTVDDEGNRVNDDGGTYVPATDDLPPAQSELARLVAKWNTIEERIAESLYSSISGSSYIENNIFSEKKFLKGLLSSMEDVQDPEAIGFEGKCYEWILDPEVEAKEVFTKEVGEAKNEAVNVPEEEGATITLKYAPIKDVKLIDAGEEATVEIVNAETGEIKITGATGTVRVSYTYNHGTILHRSYYQSAQFHYVEKKIIPTIYRQLLNEQYLLDETYNTLGRSYARKVNIIKISDNKNLPKASDYLMKQLVKQINETPDADTIADSSNKVNLDTFKMYASLYVGSNLTDEQISLIEDTDLKDIFLDEGDYYKGTEYGDLMEQYNKIYIAPLIPGSTATIDTTAESTFTDSHKYTKEAGLELKTRELELKDYTTSGWFIKNGGLTELPDAIRNRLFNIGVANGVKETTEAQNAADRWQKNEEGAWEYKLPEDESPYVARINGKNYLKTSSSIDGSDRKSDILHYDSSSSTYYIIQIEEASSSSKLSKKSNNSYAELRGKAAMEEIVNEITKIVGAGESYSTLAEKYFLEKMSLEYHDEVVYNYFKENYPELFE